MQETAECQNGSVSMFFNRDSVKLSENLKGSFYLVQAALINSKMLCSVNRICRVCIKVVFLLHM